MIKQSWTPLKQGSDMDLEWRVHAKAGSSLAGRIHDHEELADCKTIKSFRRDCPAIPISNYEEIMPPSPALVRKDAEDEQSVAYLPKAREGEPTFEECQPIIERQLSRVVINCRGLPIKYCKDLPELIRTLRGVLKSAFQLSGGPLISADHQS